MYIKASKSLTALYCVALISGLLPMALLGYSGFLGLFRGGGWTSALSAISLLSLLPYAVFCVYRLLTIARLRPALDAYITSATVRLLRLLGVAGMAIGAIGTLAATVSMSPLLNIFGVISGSATGWMSSLPAWLVAGMSYPSLILFELSRTVGFETKLHEKIVQREGR